MTSIPHVPRRGNGALRAVAAALGLGAAVVVLGAALGIAWRAFAWLSGM